MIRCVICNERKVKTGSEFCVRCFSTNKNDLNFASSTEDDDNLFFSLLDTRFVDLYKLHINRDFSDNENELIDEFDFLSVCSEKHQFSKVRNRTRKRVEIEQHLKELRAELAAGYSRLVEMQIPLTPQNIIKFSNIHVQQRMLQNHQKPQTI